MKQYRSVLLLWIAVLLLFLLGNFVSPGFFSVGHAGAIFRAAAFVGIAAIGQTLVVLTGGIDLTVGALISLGNVFACFLLDGQDANNYWVVPLIMLIGLVTGALNGLGVAILGISPMVMTLALGVVTQGVTLVYSKGAPSGNASPFLRSLGVGEFAGIPLPVFIWLAASAVTLLLLKKHIFGRGIYYVGANETSATFSGIRVNLVKTVAYAASGLTAVLTGVLYAGYTSTAFVNIGADFTMQSITAVVIGGTAMTGGKGGYGGTIAGAVLLCLVESIMTLLHMQQSGRKVMNGLIIIALIVFYYREAGKKKS